MFKLLLAAMLTTHAADAATTCVALSRGFVEANPIFGARATCGRVIGEKAVVVGLSTAAALELRAHHPKLATFVVSVGATSGGVAFTLNLSALRGR